MAMLTTTRNALKYLGSDAAVDTWLTYRNGYADAFQIIDAALAKCNFASTTDPTTGDDSGDGYVTGSRWHNTTSHRIFVCENATLGAAVWRQVWPPKVYQYTSLLGIQVEGSVDNVSISLKNTSTDGITWYIASCAGASGGGVGNLSIYNGTIWVAKLLSTGLYLAGNCSAATFTDRTPGYEGDALAEISKVRNINGKIDHATLPKFARSAKISKNDKGEYVEEVGRDIGAMVSILTVAVQQLTERLEKLETMDSKG